MAGLPLPRDTQYDMPEYAYGALERYLTHGTDPGDFLVACLENNLSQAAAKADDSNRRRLADIVCYLYNYLPSDAWGSKEKVLTYIDHIKGDGMEAYRAACEESGDVPCVDRAHHKWVIQDENPNVAYCEKCGTPEY